MAVYVNGEKIQTGMIANEADRLRPHYQQAFPDQSPEEQEKQLFDWSKENVIELTLLIQHARELFPDISEREYGQALQNAENSAGDRQRLYESMGVESDDEDTLKERIEDSVRYQKLMDKVSAEAKDPTDKQIQKHYRENIERYTIPESVRAAHIVKHPDPNTERQSQLDQMRDILENIRSGETTFEQAAGENSDCPDSGGDLGYFSRGKMVPSFEQVVFNMDVGQVSDVFETEFGCHIAKVTDKKPSVACELEQVRPVVEKEVRELNTRKRLEKLIDSLREKADIAEKEK